MFITLLEFEEFAIFDSPMYSLGRRLLVYDRSLQGSSHVTSLHEAKCLCPRLRGVHS